MELKTKNFIEFSAPFIQAIKKTFEVMLSSEVKAHSPKKKSDELTPEDITCIIGMNGKREDQDFSGQIAISLSEDVYLKIASQMLMDEYTEFTEEISDAGNELINIIMGNSKSPLAEQGYKISMATPTMIRGKNVEIRYPKDTITIETTIESNFGNFIFEICYKEV